MSENTITTTARLDHPVGIHAIQRFLAYMMPKLVHEQFGDAIDMPTGEGKTVKWRRWTPPTAQTTPNVEGVDGSAVVPSKTDLQVDLDRYSAWVKWTEWLDLIGWSQDAKQLTEWLADMAAITRDTGVREVLANCASSVTMSNGGATATHLNATDLDTAVQALMGYADPITPMITAGKGVGTTPIAPAYIAIGHTDLWSTLINVAGFREVQVYASTGGAYENEVGSTRHIRWLLTRNAKKVSTTYTVPLLGTKAYGTVKLPAGEQMLGYKPPEQSGSPTNAWSIYFYKFWAASKILDDTRMLRLICTT